MPCLYWTPPKTLVSVRNLQSSHPPPVVVRLGATTLIKRRILSRVVLYLSVIMLAVMLTGPEKTMDACIATCAILRYINEDWLAKMARATWSA